MSLSARGLVFGLVLAGAHGPCLASTEASFPGISTTREGRAWFRPVGRGDDARMAAWRDSDRRVLAALARLDERRRSVLPAGITPSLGTTGDRELAAYRAQVSRREARASPLAALRAAIDRHAEDLAEASRRRALAAAIDRARTEARWLAEARQRAIVGRAWIASLERGARRQVIRRARLQRGGPRRPVPRPEDDGARAGTAAKCPAAGSACRTPGVTPAHRRTQGAAQRRDRPNHHRPLRETRSRLDGPSARAAGPGTDEVPGPRFGPVAPRPGRVAERSPRHDRPTCAQRAH